MARTETISLKVEPMVVDSLETEAEERDLSRSEYIREVLSNRNATSEAIADLNETIRSLQGEIEELEKELVVEAEEHEVEKIELQRVIEDKEQTIQSLKSQQRSVSDYARSQKQIEETLDRDVKKMREQMVVIEGMATELNEKFEGIREDFDKRQGRMLHRLDTIENKVNTTKSEIANTRRYAKDAERQVATHFNNESRILRVVKYVYRAFYKRYRALVRFFT